MALAEGEWLGDSCWRDGNGIGEVAAEEEMGRSRFWTQLFSILKCLQFPNPIGEQVDAQAS